MQIQKQENQEKIEIGLNCPKCGKSHKILASPQSNGKKKQIKNPNVTADEKLICDNCGFEIDLKPIKNDLELKLKTKIYF